MDTVEVKVQETGAVVVHTDKITKGGADKPQRAVPYAPKSACDRGAIRHQRQPGRAIVELSAHGQSGIRFLVGDSGRGGQNRCPA